MGARHDHERVLELDPNYLDAKMVVGTHNYVIGRSALERESGCGYRWVERVG